MCYVASFFSKERVPKDSVPPQRFVSLKVTQMPRPKIISSLDSWQPTFKWPLWHNVSRPLYEVKGSSCRGRKDIRDLSFFLGCWLKGLKELRFVPLTTHLVFGPHFPLNHDSGKKRYIFTGNEPQDIPDETLNGWSRWLTISFWNGPSKLRFWIEWTRAQRTETEKHPWDFEGRYSSDDMYVFFQLR